MAQPVLADTIFTRLNDLERRLVALERSPQLTSASIKDGALTIYNLAGQAVAVFGKQSSGRYGLSTFNAAGQRTLELGELASSRSGLEVPDPATGIAQIRVGQLASGGYGLEAVSGGQTITLDKLAFGIQAARVDTSESHVAGGGFADLATVGPAVSVDVGAAGRLLVQVTCGISGGSGGQGKAGFEISGATAVAASVNSAVIIGGAVGVAEVGQAGATYLVTGLNAGSHVVKMVYASTGTTMTYFARTLAVQPF